MDLFDAITSPVSAGLPVPVRWLASPHLARHPSLFALAESVGRLDDSSDAVLRALLARDIDDELVAPAILLGLRRLLYLCRGRDRELLNDLVTEVAIVIGEMRRGGPPTVGRRLGYVIVDRARDRQRSALRRQLGRPVVDPVVAEETLADPAPAVDELVVQRAQLAEIRTDVLESSDAGLVRSWNSLLQMVETPRSSQAERDRWKYVRRRLAQHLDPGHAA